MVGCSPMLMPIPNEPVDRLTPGGSGSGAVMNDPLPLRTSEPTSCRRLVMALYAYCNPPCALMVAAWGRMVGLGLLGDAALVVGARLGTRHCPRGVAAAGLERETDLVPSVGVENPGRLQSDREVGAGVSRW